MAIDINRVYQKVLVLANKEQRGYITPQEFNLLADAAQKEIYENYFHQSRNSNIKIKDDDDYTDTLEIIEQKLDQFFVQQITTDITNNVVNLFNSDATTNQNLNQDIYKLISVGVAYSGSDNVYLASKVNKLEFRLINTGNGVSPSVLNPSKTRPIYYIKNKLRGQTASSISANPEYDIIINTGYSSDNINFIHYDYYRNPKSPNWAYVIVNGKALYNSNNSIDFELDLSEESTLVSKILLLAGGVIKQPDISQGAMSLLQLKNQEQNS